MFADTLLRAEQQHLLRLFVWCALSIIAGTALATLLAVRRSHSPLLRQFAIQMTAWGALVGALTVARWFTLGMRDVAGAARLERFVWFSAGLDTGLVGAGLMLAVAAWLSGRRAGLFGAGVGVLIQGMALLLLDLQFAAVVSR